MIFENLLHCTKVIGQLKKHVLNPHLTPFFSEKQYKLIFPGYSCHRSYKLEYHPLLLKRRVFRNEQSQSKRGVRARYYSD